MLTEGSHDPFRTNAGEKASGSECPQAVVSARSDPIAGGTSRPVLNNAFSFD